MKRPWPSSWSARISYKLVVVVKVSTNLQLRAPEPIVDTITKRLENPKLHPFPQNNLFDWPTIDNLLTSHIEYLQLLMQYSVPSNCQRSEVILSLLLFCDVEKFARFRSPSNHVLEPGFLQIFERDFQTLHLSL